MKFPFKITKQFTKDEEKDVASFAEFKNAMEYIQWCLEKDAALKIESIYRLYNQENNTVQKFSSSNIKSSPSRGPQAQFKPTPLQMKPRPPGVMPYIEYPTDEDDKESNKNDDAKK